MHQRLEAPIEPLIIDDAAGRVLALVDPGELLVGDAELGRRRGGAAEADMGRGPVEEKEEDTGDGQVEKRPLQFNSPDRFTARPATMRRPGSCLLTRF
jgi:hypothetical protein